jgi:hypothetical protein
MKDHLKNSENLPKIFRRRQEIKPLNTCGSSDVPITENK